MLATLTDRDRLNDLLAHSPSLPQAEEFLLRCSPTARELLAACQWQLARKEEDWLLAIACPNADTTWQALHDLDALIAALHPCSSRARIAIYPPDAIGSAFTTDLADPWGYATSPWDDEQDD